MKPSKKITEKKIRAQLCSFLQPPQSIEMLLSQPAQAADIYDHPISRCRDNHPVLHSSFPAQWIYFFFLSHLTTERPFVFGVRQRHCANGLPNETWTSMNSEGSQNICVFQAAPTADGSRDTCAREPERWSAELATSRKRVLLTDWSFFLAAFASSDTSRLLWKQDVIITSTAFGGFYISKSYDLVTQWLKCHFYLKPLNISVLLALVLTHWCFWYCYNNITISILLSFLSWQFLNLKWNNTENSLEYEYPQVFTHTVFKLLKFFHRNFASRRLDSGLLTAVLFPIAQQ